VPENLLLPGRWSKPHPQDDYMKLRREVLDQQPYRDGQYVITHDDPVFSYAKDKKFQEAWMKKQQFMSYFFDPKNPEYNAIVHQRFPGLRAKKDEIVEDEEVVKAAYYMLYDKGFCENDEDVNWALRLTHPETYIPLIGTRERFFIDAAKALTAAQHPAWTARKSGLFSVRRFGGGSQMTTKDETKDWISFLLSGTTIDADGVLAIPGSEDTDHERQIKEQFAMKLLLLVRILPRFRGRKPEEIVDELDAIMTNKSSVEDVLTDPSYAKVGSTNYLQRVKDQRLETWAGRGTAYTER